VAPVVDFEFAKWEKLLAIYFDGAFLTTRKFRVRTNEAIVPYPEAAKGNF